MKYRYQIFTFVLAILSAVVYSQEIYPKPKYYYCYTTVDSIIIDGNLNEKSWDMVQWSDPFVDIEGKDENNPEFETKYKMLRNKNGLYIAAYLEEPHINASKTENESVIFQDNDFEIFLDPDGDNHNYYELEINALNIYWDLFMSRPYGDMCTANSSWDIKELQTAVRIYGTINDASDIDSCWIVELMIPWKSIIDFAPGRKIPNSREVWRMNLSRVQWKYDIIDGKYSKKKMPASEMLEKEHNSVWTPQWVINMHNPESWGYIIFAGHPLSMEPILSEPDKDYKLKMYLVNLYRLQKRFYLKNHFYANSLRELTGEKEGLYPVIIETTSKQFIMHCSNYNDKTWYIDQHRKLWAEPIQRQK